MMNKRVSDSLRTEEQWNQVWKGAKLPKTVKKNNLLGFQLDKLMKKHLQQGGKFLEIGCAGGRFLVYFNQEFGFYVTGVDYSKTGCILSEKNLELSNIDGKIICDDIFKCETIEKNSFDIVFSGGFIEHFKHTREVLEKHIEFLKPGGMLIISLPNMNGLHGFIFRIFNPKSFHSHKRITAEQLEEELKGLNIKIIESKYIGSLILESGGKPKFMQYLFYIFNKIIYWLVRILHISFNSRFVSPYIVVIGQKLS